MQREFKEVTRKGSLFFIVIHVTDGRHVNTLWTLNSILLTFELTCRTSEANEVNVKRLVGLWFIEKWGTEGQGNMVALTGRMIRPAFCPSFPLDSTQGYPHGRSAQCGDSHGQKFGQYDTLLFTVRDHSPTNHNPTYSSLASGSPVK